MIIVSHDNQTIVAQCTPKGKGALALISVSGDHAIDIVNAISKLASGKALRAVPSHTIHYGQVVNDDGHHIDHVMFYVMHAPRTFTGQNVVDISCHNNPFIIERIMAQAIAHGARPAQAGEFAKRSVLNGKLDLTQAEAINELVHANTQQALKQSLAQLEGSLARWVTTLEKQLIKALALSEASFEFIDEDMAFAPQINEILTYVLSTITTLKKSYDQQKQIREGIRIALIGSVNAGKSSLFNTLLNKQRAIVTAIAGTTRDAIEAGICRNSQYWTLIDTAGLRKTNDVIEQEGIKRSLMHAQEADIIVLVCDGARELLEQERDFYTEILATYSKKVILVHNKSDELSFTQRIGDTHSFLPLSTKTQHNIVHLEKTLDQKCEQLFHSLESPFLLNQRQFNLLLSLEQKLINVQGMLNAPVHYELLSAELTDALAHVSELTGKSISEQGMDAVFREFCVGK